MIARFKKNSYQWSPLATVLIIVLACISLPDARRTKASETLASQPTHQPTFRKIRIPHDASRLRSEAQLSPDGKSIAFVINRKLWVMPRTGALGPDFPGTPTLLNTGDIELTWEGLTWSRDGRWIAFNDRKWIEGDGPNRNKRMYVISVDGGKPKEVYKNWREHYVVNYRMSLSPNGKTLAFSTVDANEQHIYTKPVDGGVPKRVVEAPAREPVFSPDGNRIAYVEDKKLGTEGGGLWVVSAHGGTPKLVADAEHATSPVWSPDGRMIAFLDNTTRRQINIIPISENGGPAGQMMTVECPEGIDAITRLTGWTPDNKIGTIFFEHPEYELYTLPATGGIVTLVAHGEKLLRHPRWSPDSKRIIYTNNVREGRDGWLHYGLASISAEGGESSTIPVRADTQIIKLSYGGGGYISPDGQTIVFAGHKKQEAWWLNHIWTLPIEGGEPKQLTNAPAPLTHWYPCWSPDGKAIAFIRCKNDPTAFASADRGIFIISADGGEPRQLTRESDMLNFGCIAWSPDGKWLAYFSLEKEYLRIKVVPAQGEPSRVVGKLEQGLNVQMELAWSPDSKRIAFNGGKVIKIMSLDDGSIVDVDPHLTDTHIYHLDWSRDGDRLVFAGRQGGNLGFWMMENFLPTTVTSAAK